MMFCISDLYISNNEGLKISYLENLIKVDR